MSSLVSGYEYDIFISYRQKDNKYVGWVTEFVDNLRKELEATFKDEIGVYFDINPHDGLLETHDVDASLKDKLKCLIFIPIISRTYCDPKSFAWEHEFKAFVEQASQDQFGLKVKLPNGNVTNRVLPIRIHDLDIADIKECESVLGGVLRGIEFIYKEPGVNKPLAIEDDEKKNLNNTKYRIQINKVANAIKEIISGLETESVSVVKEKEQPEEPFKTVREDEKKKEVNKPVKSFKYRWLSIAAIAALLVIAAIIAYLKIFKQDRLEKLRSAGERISVAVMPFQNLTNDTIWNVWQDGIQDILINNLTNSEELVVRQIESISDLLQSKGLNNYASITPTIASDISQKLETNIFINGSIKQVGTTIRLNAQLIDNKSGETYKSFQIDGNTDNILHITDSLSIMLRNFLIISKLGEQATLGFKNPVSTNFPDAYRFYLMGNNAFGKKDCSEAIKMFLQAKEIDSNYIDAQIRIPFAFENQGLYKQEKEWCLKLYAKRDKMTLKQKIYLNYICRLF
jgi:TolB-like protein